MLLFWTTNTAVVTSRANQQLGNVRKPYIHSNTTSNLLLMLLLFSWWCQSIGCVLNTLLSSFFSTKQATKSIKMLSQCKSFCIPQFTPWFETRCTVDIDGFYNFRYPLCMGKLSYLKQKDVTPLITIFTAEDDETMNGRKPGWTEGSSSNVYSTLGYGDECSMTFDEKASVTSQNCHNIRSCVLLACHAAGTPRERSLHLMYKGSESWQSCLESTVPRKILFVISEERKNKFLEIEMRGKVNLFKFG